MRLHPPFIPLFNTGSIVLSSPPSPPLHPPFCHNPPYPLRDEAPPRAGAHPWKRGCVSLVLGCGRYTLVNISTFFDPLPSTSTESYAPSDVISAVVAS